MISIFIIALTVTGALIIRGFGLRLGVRHNMQTGTAAPASTALDRNGRVSNPPP